VRAALAIKHEQHQPALVAVLAGLTLDVVDEHDPIVQSRVELGVLRIEVVLDMTLAVALELTVGAADEHLAGHGPIDPLRALTQGLLVAVLGRFLGAFSNSYFFHGLVSLPRVPSIWCLNRLCQIATLTAGLAASFMEP